MTADGHSKGSEDLEESFNPSAGSDANGTDARVEADITRILSDGNLDDAELD